MLSILFSIDTKTLILLTVHFFVVNTIFLFFLYRIRRQVFLKWLAYGCLSFAVGWLLFALRFQYGLNVISLSIANIFILLLPIALIFSIYSFLKIPYPKPHLAGTLFVLVLAFTFLFLTWSMQDPWIPGLYTSIVNGSLYFVAGLLLLRLAHPKQAILWTMVALNFLIALVLGLRACILVFGWLNPGIVSAAEINRLLVAALYFNVICVYAQVLCFPIVDLMDAQRELERANRKLKEMSHTDELTGLPNRRAMNAQMDLELARSRMDNAALSVILFDLDHFKAINDRFGHPTGDFVLCQIAAQMKHMVRPTDHVMRYGGEEFVVLLPGTDCTEAFEIAERLRIGLSQFHVEHPDLTTSLRLTASFGVAGASPEWLSEDELLKRADLALYKAKAQGRNQVCV